MKKLLLSFAAVAFFTLSSIAQCTPGANYADSTFGAWPDTIENFPPANTGLPYTTDLNFKVPVNASDVDPSASGTIQSFSVDAVNGLPPGMNYTCNNGTCDYAGGENGCAQLTGTCNTPGTYNITIDVTGQVELFPGVVIPYPYTFEGYKIQVSDLGFVSLIAPEFELYPNPGTNLVTLDGLAKFDVESVQMINMAGEVVATYANISSAALTMDVTSLETGVYFVKINHDEVSNIVKFVKE